MLIADLALRPEAKGVINKYSSKHPEQARAIFQQTDVTSWADLSRAFQIAQNEFGRIDLVCPGAGVFEPQWSSFWHPPGTSHSKDKVDGDRYASLDINLTHPIRMTQLAISHFLSDHDGSKASPSNPKRVVMISSIAGESAPLPVPIYCAAKHAVIGFTRSLAALDETLSIRVSAVAPGIIKTPLWTDHPEKLKFLDETQDLWATPEEVAEAMLLLAESEDMKGGTILEVGHEQTRVVPLFNNQGPSGAGMSVSGISTVVKEVFDCLAEKEWGKPKQS